MAQKRKGPVKFTPSPHNIRVNSRKELRDKLDYDSLSPINRLAIDSAAREYLKYILSLPMFNEMLKGLSGDFDKTSSDDVMPDE